MQMIIVVRGPSRRAGHSLGKTFSLTMSTSLSSHPRLAIDVVHVRPKAHTVQLEPRHP